MLPTLDRVMFKQIIFEKKEILAVLESLSLRQFIDDYSSYLAHGFLKSMAFKGI